MWESYLPQIPQRKIHNPPDMLPELSHINSPCDLSKMVISGVTGTTVRSVIRRSIDNHGLGAVRQRQSALAPNQMEGVRKWLAGLNLARAPMVSSASY